MVVSIAPYTSIHFIFQREMGVAFRAKSLTLRLGFSLFQLEFHPYRLPHGTLSASSL